MGKILALRYALAPARVATRELLACLRQLPLRQTAAGHAARDYDASVRLSDGAIAELLFWQDLGQIWNGLQWTATAPDVVLYTDACPGGWGALAVAVERGQEGPVLDWEQGLQPRNLSDHSIRTELHALLAALISMGEAWRGGTVRHRTDSKGTYYGLCNGGFSTGEHSDLNELVRRIWMASAYLEINIQPEFVGKEVILRSGADQLSREEAEDKLRLHRVRTNKEGRYLLSEHCTCMYGMNQG